MTESIDKMITFEESSKRSRLSPKPEIEEELLPPSKKMKTTSQTSKPRISEKKQEVTVSEEAVEIIETDCGEINVNETPSKKSFKPVSDHVKTPFSKIKENDEDAGTPVKGSLKKSQEEKMEQRNLSGKKSSIKKEAVSVSRMENGSSKSSILKLKESLVEEDCTKNVREGQSDPALDVTTISEEPIDSN